MGWDFGWDSHESLIQHNTRSWNSGNERSECLAHVVSPGVLWAVWEVTTPDKQYRWIACDLIKHGPDGWGYKGMSESMEPYTYNCPLKFLEMVAPIAPNDFNLEWRKKVVEHWQKYRAVREIKKAIKIGDTLILKNAKIPEVYVISLKPLIGIWAGRQYKIPPRFIDRIGMRRPFNRGE